MDNYTIAIMEAAKNSVINSKEALAECYTVEFINSFVGEQIHSLQLQNYALFAAAVGLVLVFLGLNSMKDKRIKKMIEYTTSLEKELQELRANRVFGEQNPANVKKENG